MALDLNVVKRGTECELRMVGHLDAVTAPGAQEAMLLLSEQYDSIILNFAELSYISSAGLRALKAIRTAMRKKNGNLALKGVSKEVMEIFEVTGFAGLFQYVS